MKTSKPSSIHYLGSCGLKLAAATIVSATAAGCSPSPETTTTSAVSLQSISWARVIDGAGHAGVAVGSDGSAYVMTSEDVGYPASNGSSGILTKYAPDGAKLWAKPLRGSAAPPGAPAVRDDDSVYIVEGRALTKYKSDGSLEWSYDLTNDAGFETSLYYPPLARSVLFATVAVLSDGSAFVAGAADTGNGGGDGSLFFSKYTADGNHVWTTFADVGDTYRLAITAAGAPDGSCYVGTTAIGRFDIETISGKQSLVPKGQLDAVVLRINADGRVAWVNSGGGIGLDTTVGVSANPDGSVYVSGYYSGAADFGSQSLRNDQDITAYAQMAFIGKYHADGTLEWVKGARGIAAARALSVATAANGSALVLGNLTYAADFGNAQSASSPDHTIFLAQYDPNGNCTKVESSVVGITGSWHVASSKSATYITAEFQGSPKLGSETIEAAGGRGLLLARLGK